MPQVFLINPDGTTEELQSDGLVKDILMMRFEKSFSGKELSRM